MFFKQIFRFLNMNTSSVNMLIQMEDSKNILNSNSLKKWKKVPPLFNFKRLPKGYELVCFYYRSMNLMFKMKMKHFLKFLLDFGCLLLIGLPVWAFNADIVPVARMGYFCSDNGIRYPYKKGQIPSYVLFLEGFVTFFVICCAIECLRLYNKSKNSSKFYQIFYEVYRAIGYLVTGAAANTFLTDIGKHTVGRLRPHFLDICNSSVVCNENNQNVYITDYTCLNTEHPLIPKDKFQDILLDSRKSFPSGHSSFALFFSFYFALYLEYRCSNFRRFRLLRHLFQIGALVWALWTCSTRVIDFKHRFSDVAAGLILGTFVAICTFYFYRSSAEAAKTQKKRKETTSNRSSLVEVRVQT